MAERNYSRRRAVQGISALLQNADLRGFFTGKLNTGPGKYVCVPGLNCYSCPAAVGSCPVGALQNALGAKHFRFPYYVLGLLLFFGAVLGRAVCGFLCPFGLLQELLYGLPLPKKELPRPVDRLLRGLKYAVLLVLVILLPLTVKLTPFFCKYLCPSGTLSGILLALSDTRIFALFGSRFAWKLAILCAVLLCSGVIFRPFCKYLCPLGAFYAPFNRVSLLRLRVDGNRCTGCGRCARACGMGVDPCRHPDSGECIRCGECVGACPVHAVTLSFRETESGVPEKSKP